MLMDSVPPATITSRGAAHDALGARTRSPRSPDAQKRLTVTADAVCGTPARRLAMRATFRPCSASGIAQPRITSSISRWVDARRALERPGDHRCRHVVGPRGPQRAAGALPTAVLTAATMTASCMIIPLGSTDSVAAAGKLDSTVRRHCRTARQSATDLRWRRPPPSRGHRNSGRRRRSRRARAAPSSSRRTSGRP